LKDDDAMFGDGGYGNYKNAQAANIDEKPPLIDCQIEIKDIATEENFLKIFPTNDEGVSTVADIFKKPYEDLRVKCANKKDPKKQNPTSNGVKSSAIKQ
jgi:acetoacetate decarboxylase